MQCRGARSQKQGDAGEAQRSSALQRDVAHTSAFLLSFFRAVCTSGQAEHPHLQRTLAMCLGDYAAWFAR